MPVKGCCRCFFTSVLCHMTPFPIFASMRIPITLGDKRIEELDFLKCVFIILMIAFHLIYIGNTYPVAKQLVYTFHMPGFLLVSGYLFNVRKSWSRVGHTLLWILIPYAVMEIGYTVMASLLPIREHIDHLSVGYYWTRSSYILSVRTGICTHWYSAGQAIISVSASLGYLGKGKQLCWQCSLGYFPWVVDSFHGLMPLTSLWVFSFVKAWSTSVKPSLLGGGLSFLWWHYAG